MKKIKTAAVTAFAVLSMSAVAQGVNYENSIKHDHACFVEAVSADGDVYLRCTKQKGILKTTVETPTISDLLDQKTLRERAASAKRDWVARANWSMILWALSSQNKVLIHLNENKTLITHVTAYVGSGFKAGTSF